MQLTNRIEDLELDNDFYSLNDVVVGRCFVDSGMKKLRVKNARDHEFLYDSPVTVGIVKGGAGSFLGFGLPGSFLVSMHLKSKMEDAQLTGLEYLPATVIHPRAPEPIQYYQIYVSGWGGLVPQKSIKWQPDHTVRNLRRYSGLKNDEELISKANWDGSDFFRVWPIPAWTFVSRKVAELFQELKIKEVNLIPLCEFDLQTFDDEEEVSLRVEPLSCYYRPEFAKEVGGPLEIDWW